MLQEKFTRWQQDRSEQERNCFCTPHTSYSILRWISVMFGDSAWTRTQKLSQETRHSRLVCKDSSKEREWSEANQAPYMVKVRKAYVRKYVSGYKRLRAENHCTYTTISKEDPRIAGHTVWLAVDGEYPRFRELLSVELFIEFVCQRANTERAINALLQDSNLLNFLGNAQIFHCLKDKQTYFSQRNGNFFISSRVQSQLRVNFSLMRLIWWLQMTELTSATHRNSILELLFILESTSFWAIALDFTRDCREMPQGPLRF